MDAEFTSGSLLSGFISVLFDRMASRDVMIMLRGKKDVVKMLDELKVNLMTVNVVLDDAEEKQLTSPDVKIWLDELTHVIYRADFLMEKIETEASQRAREDEPATTTSTYVGAFETRVIDEGNQILERLNLLLDQKSRLGFREGGPTRSLQRLQAPLVGKESDVVGRDGDKEEIIELLTSRGLKGWLAKCLIPFSLLYKWKGTSTLLHTWRSKRKTFMRCLPYRAVRGNLLKVSASYPQPSTHLLRRKGKRR